MNDLSHVYCPYCGKDNYFMKGSTHIICVKCRMISQLHNNMLVLRYNQYKKMKNDIRVKTIFLSITLLILYFWIGIDFVNQFSPHRYVEGRDKIYAKGPKYDSETGETYEAVIEWTNPKNQYHKAHYKDSQIDWYDPITKTWHNNQDPLFTSTIHMIMIAVIVGILIYAHKRFKEKIPDEYHFVYYESINIES